MTGNTWRDNLGSFFNVGSTVSPSSDIKPDDVLKTKSALNTVGHYLIPDFGLSDTPDIKMIDGLKDFQANNGLKVDGVMKPGGPTEAALAQTLSTQDYLTADLERKTEPSPASITAQTPKPDHTALYKTPSPTKQKLPKLDPITGLQDPLASSPKGTMPTKKQWQEVAKVQQQKAKAALIPQGDTVEERLRSLMSDKRYNDRHDPSLRDHVQRQFQKAFPGQVNYDETGKMAQPTAAIHPDQVEAFDPEGELQTLAPLDKTESDTFTPVSTGVEKESFAYTVSDGTAERPTHYSSQNEELIREKRYNGLEEDAFADMQNILLKDPEGFQKFSQENRAAYQAYQEKQRQYWRPDRTVSEAEQVKRNAIEISRQAGAGSYILPEAKRAFFNNAADVAHGAVVLSGGNQEQIDAIEKTRQRKMAENPLPAIYKGRTIGQYADDVINLNPLSGALSAAGQTAKDLEKMGVSKDGQQIGAALMGLVGLVGTKATKLGAGEIKKFLAKQFGNNWSKRLMPKDVEILNDQLIGQGLQVGVDSGLRSAVDSYGKTTEN